MDENTRQALDNVKRAKQAEQQRIAAIVETSNREVNTAYEQRQAEQQHQASAQEQAQQQRERDRLAAVEADARQRAYAAWRDTGLGSEADFTTAWPAIWAQHQQEAAARAIVDRGIAVRAGMRF